MSQKHGIEEIVLIPIWLESLSINSRVSSTCSSCNCITDLPLLLSLLSLLPTEGNTELETKEGGADETLDEGIPPESCLMVCGTQYPATLLHKRKALLPNFVKFV